MKEGEFFSFVGQSTEAITGMFNLYRASQVMFPGEKILEEARKFSTSFLRRKQACNELLDKWIMTKDLPGEVNKKHYIYTISLFLLSLNTYIFFLIS